MRTDRRIQQLIESEVFDGSVVPAALRPVPGKNSGESDDVDLYLDGDAFPEAVRPRRR